MYEVSHICSGTFFYRKTAWILITSSIANVRAHTFLGTFPIDIPQTSLLISSTNTFCMENLFRIFVKFSIDVL